MKFKISILVLVSFCLNYTNASFGLESEENKELVQFSGKPHMSRYARRQLNKLRKAKFKQEEIENNFNFEQIRSLKLENCAIYGIEWSRDNNLYCSTTFNEKDANDNYTTIKKHHKIIVIDPFEIKIKFQNILGKYNSYKILLSPDETKVHLNAEKGHPDLMIYDFKTKIYSYDYENLSPLGSSFQNPIRKSAWSPSSNKLAAGFGDGTILIYDMESKQTINRFELPYMVFTLSWSPDGSKLLFNLGDQYNSVCLLDIESETYDILYRHKIENGVTGPRVNQFVWLSDTVFAACSNFKIVYWDIQEQRAVKTFYTQIPEEETQYTRLGDREIPVSYSSTDCSLVLLSPDAKFLAILKKPYYSFGPSLISIFNMQNKKFVAQDLGFFNGDHYSEIKDLKWSHDSQFLAATSGYQEIRIWGKVSN